MTRTSVMMIVTGALGFLANPAMAASNIDDIRCFMVSNAFAQGAKEEKDKQVAVLVRFYSLGRIQGRSSPAEIKASIVQVGKELNNATAPGIMNTCAANLAAAEKAIGVIGQELQTAKPK